MANWDNTGAPSGDVRDRRGPLPLMSWSQQTGDKPPTSPQDVIDTTTDPTLKNMLNSIFDVLSDRLAGGRVHPTDLLPGQGDPLEGLIPDEVMPDLHTVDWFDPTVWAQATPDELGKVDLVNITAGSGPGKDGKGLDWFRAGEAPNNYANRHNPLYKARREFAMSITPKIEDMFGVSAHGSAGYMRTPKSSDARKGGRSANSDHYSGGAIDFFGTKEEMVALRNWAVQQPWASFVRCQSESHYDHVHLSIDVGWIAQNYFQGRSIPQVSNRVSLPPKTPTSNTPRTAKPAAPGVGGVPV